MRALPFKLWVFSGEKVGSWNESMHFGRDFSLYTSNLYLKVLILGLNWRLN